VDLFHFADSFSLAAEVASRDRQRSAADFCQTDQLRGAGVAGQPVSAVLAGGEGVVAAPELSAMPSSKPAPPPAMSPPVSATAATMRLCFMCDPFTGVEVSRR
jgi:hypothetical protein